LDSVGFTRAAQALRVLHTVLADMTHVIFPQATTSKSQDNALGRPYRPATAGHRLPHKAVAMTSSDTTPGALSSTDAGQPQSPTTEPATAGAKDAVGAIASAVEVPIALLQKLIAPSRRGSADAVAKHDSPAAAKSQQMEVRATRRSVRPTGSLCTQHMRRKPFPAPPFTLRTPPAYHMSCAVSTTHAPSSRWL
jgi:hypothetical protein